MSRGLLGALIAGALLLAGLILAYWLRDGDDEVPTRSRPTESIDITEIDEAELVPGVVYFPDARGSLTGEKRQVRPAATTEERARALLEAILAGPTGPGLGRPFPEGTQLGTTMLSPSSVLYVDLVSTEHIRPPITGSLEELLAVYSLVNSVLLDSPEIRAVVLLWNGQQPTTFAGHLDTSLPLGPDRDLIRRGG